MDAFILAHPILHIIFKVWCFAGAIIFVSMPKKTVKRFGRNWIVFIGGPFVWLAYPFAWITARLNKR